MARTAVAGVSEREQNGRVVAFDRLRFALFTVHLAVIAYISLGWLIPSRAALFFYTLLLPMIVIQWLLNGGASIVNNTENLVRSGRWSDPRNELEGAFFKTFLQGLGVPASQAQITTVLCFMMLIFWIAAICHMILIVVPAA